MLPSIIVLKSVSVYSQIMVKNEAIDWKDAGRKNAGLVCTVFSSPKFSQAAWVSPFLEKGWMDGCIKCVPQRSHKIHFVVL